MEGVKYVLERLIRSIRTIFRLNFTYKNWDIPNRSEKKLVWKIIMYLFIETAQGNSTTKT